MLRFTRLGSALAGCAAAAVVSTAAMAETTKVGAVYAVTVGGFRFAEGRLSLVVQNNAYSAKLDMSSSGLGSIFSSGHGNASSTGWLRQAHVLPARYNLESTSGSKQWTRVSMALNQGAVRKLNVSPKLKKRDDRIPVTSQHKRNITDPLSAILMPVKGSKAELNASACDRTLPIFDGWTRYDVAFSYKGTREVKNADYTGKVVVCGARWVRSPGTVPRRAR